MPKGFKWYYFSGESPFTNEIKDRFLSFLAQINCDNSSKLLGYSDSIQGDMLLECELDSNGLYCGDGTGYNSLKRRELETLCEIGVEKTV